jgi:hypothetical protein
MLKDNIFWLAASEEMGPEDPLTSTVSASGVSDNMPPTQTSTDNSIFGIYRNTALRLRPQERREMFETDL